MKRFILSVAMMFVSSVAMQCHGDSNIVGYESQDITRRGYHRVQINFEPLCLFPTLGDAMTFNNPTNVFGDKICFVLDGKSQTYRIVACESADCKGKHEQYHLVAESKDYPSNITLRGIPFMKEFTLIHMNPYSVSFAHCGGVSKKRMIENGIEQPQYESPFTITFISPIDGRIVPLQ